MLLMCWVIMLGYVHRAHWSRLKKAFRYISEVVKGGILYRRINMSLAEGELVLSDTSEPLYGRSILHRGAVEEESWVLEEQLFSCSFKKVLTMWEDHSYLGHLIFYIHLLLLFQQCLPGSRPIYCIEGAGRVESISLIIQNQVRMVELFLLPLHLGSQLV